MPASSASVPALCFSTLISYRPPVVALFFGDYAQKFKLKGCYIEKGFVALHPKAYEV